MKRHILKIIVVFVIVFSLTQCSEDQAETLVEPEVVTVTDADGNVYRTVTLGDQTWMLENLKTTKFNDGTPIEEYTPGENWNGEGRTLPLFQWASTLDLNNSFDEELPRDFYGAMYNHAAIESGKLAPEGWRIPSEQDWIQLRNFLASNGHLGIEGLALKSASGWVDSSGNGNNAFEFNGLPNGYVDAVGTPKADGIICTWATSNFDAANFRRRVIGLFDVNEMLFQDQSMLLGSGIRCVKN